MGNQSKIDRSRGGGLELFRYLVKPTIKDRNAPKLAGMWTNHSPTTHFTPSTLGKRKGKNNL